MDHSQGKKMWSVVKKNVTIVREILILGLQDDPNVGLADKDFEATMRNIFKDLKKDIVSMSK